MLTYDVKYWLSAVISGKTDCLQDSYWYCSTSWMWYPPSASVTNQWTVRTIVSTPTVQCWVGMKRESFVGAETPRCRSSEMSTWTTCFSDLSQTVTSPTTYGLMLMLGLSTTPPHGVGSTAKHPVSSWANVLNWKFNFAVKYFIKNCTQVIYVLAQFSLHLLSSG